jgi:3-hydroxyacyl-CoA dehydrogenase
MARIDPLKVQRVACVGGGYIGAGWAAVFLARGMDVTVSDPASGAEARVRAIVEQAWPLLNEFGVASSARPDRLRVVTSTAEAVADAEFVQESAPDSEQLKIDLFAEMDDAAPAECVLASSSSAFLPSRLQSRCKLPERVVVGHPFAPSYLMPLVEVVGGERTAPEVMDWAMVFYKAIGKVPLRLAREIDSYIANRLQEVVLEEAARLVQEGVCEFTDIDVAMNQGPGLRWAFAGPVMCEHLSGGKGGVRHTLEHFGWRFGDDEGRQHFIDAVETMAGHLSMDELERWRDINLLTLLRGLKPLPSA